MGTTVRSVKHLQPRVLTEEDNEGLPEEVGDGPIRYSRRVEGLIEHDEGARLQGVSFRSWTFPD